MVAEPGDGDDNRPLSLIFPSRRRSHHYSSPPRPPSDVSAAASALCVGDLVWVKAFPYTWWPGVLRRLKPSSAFVELFGGQNPRWYHRSKIRAFEHYYLVASRISGSRLPEEVALALQELGRRTLLGLMCPCQRTITRGLSIPHQAVDRVWRGFDPAKVVRFVRHRAVCIWGKEDGDDSRIVGLLAGVIAFRRSFGFAGVSGVWKADGVVAVLRDLAVGNLAQSSVRRTVEVVLAHRKFVSPSPDWVFRELKPRSNDSSSSEELVHRDEALRESVSQPRADDSEREDDFCGGDSSPGSCLSGSFESILEKGELMEDCQETGMVLGSISHSISVVNRPTDIVGSCLLNTLPGMESFELDAHSSFGDDGNMLGEECNSDMEVQSLPSTLPEVVMEECEESSTTCPDVCKTSGNAVHILHDLLIMLRILASDPCQVMVRSFEDRLRVFLKLREFLSASVSATDSITSSFVAHDMKDVPNPEEDVVPTFSAEGSRHPKYRRATSGSEAVYKTLPCGKVDIASDLDMTIRTFLSLKAQGRQFVNLSTTQGSDVELQKMLHHIRSLAVNPFYHKPENLETVCKGVHIFRHATFLSTPRSVILQQSGSKRKDRGGSGCNSRMSHAVSPLKKQACLVDETEILVEPNQSNDVNSEIKITYEVKTDALSMSSGNIYNQSVTHISCKESERCCRSSFEVGVGDDLLIASRKYGDQNDLMRSFASLECPETSEVDLRNILQEKGTDVIQSHQLSDMPQGALASLSSGQSHFTEIMFSRTHEYVQLLHDIAVDILCVDTCSSPQMRKIFLRYRKLAFASTSQHSVAHGVEVGSKVTGGNDSRNEPKLVENILETDFAEVDKMHDTATKSSIHPHTSSQSSTENMNIISQYEQSNEVPSQGSGKAHECADLNLASSSCGVSSSDEGMIERRVIDELFTSGSSGVHQLEMSGRKMNSNNTYIEENINVDHVAGSVGKTVNQVKSYCNSSQFASQVYEDAKRIEAKLLMAKSRAMTLPTPTLKDSCHEKRRHESLPPSRHTVKQPGTSLRRLYASPLTAETSKPTSKAKFATKKNTTSCKTLHMKFPKDFKLPSKEDLEKKFRMFGQLDRSRTRIFYYTGSAEIVFVKATDAQAAYIHACKKRVYDHVNVRFWFDEHERFRSGNTSGALPTSAGESSLNIKSCLRRTDTFKENDQRKEYRVKFSSPELSVVSDRTSSFPSNTEDISGPMLRLLVKCDEVVTAIREVLGIGSYYPIFAHTDGLSAKSL